MNSISITILEGRLKDYQTKVDNARNDIRNYEDAYESLNTFKGNVLTAQENFVNATNQKTMLLAPLEPYRKYNSCVKIYLDNVKEFLDSIGTRIVGIAYSALIRMISAKLSSYYNKVDDLNDVILEYNDKIDDIQREIECQRKMEGEN